MVWDALQAVRSETVNTTNNAPAVPTGTPKSGPARAPKKAVGDAPNPDLPPKTCGKMTQAPMQPGQVPAAPRAPRASPLMEMTTDNRIQEKNPADMPIPQALLAAIGSSKHILIVGHINPDGDCYGSSLGLAAILKALGKKVDVCVDEDPANVPALCRTLDKDHEVKQAKDLSGKNWDLAICVDDVTRPKGAAELLKSAKRLAVVQHHVPPHGNDFTVADFPTFDPKAADPKDGPAFVSWSEPNFPASALQVAGIGAKFQKDFQTGGVTPEPATEKDIWWRVLAGICTDTAFGRLGDPVKLRSDYAPYVKYVVNHDAGISIDGVEKSLAFALPADIEAVLLGQSPVSSLSSVPADLKAKLQELVDKGTAIDHFVQSAPDGSAAVGVLSCSDQFLDTMAAVGAPAKPGDPVRFSRADVYDELKWNGVAALKKQLVAGTKVTAFLTETIDGKISVSLRSSSDQAAYADAAEQIARRLDPNGGGHGAAAGAEISGKTLAQVKQRIIECAREIGVSIPDPALPATP